MQSKVTIVILFLLFLIYINPLSLRASDHQPDISLHSSAAVLMDAKSGRVLYGKNADEIMAMASTTKILTCILALEHGNLSDYVEVSAYAQSMPKVKLNMRSGESYRLEDLLYSLMLESHNDTAVAIAEFIGGSVEDFARMMNDKAKEIGCENSFFITPSGLDAQLTSGKYHSTTATELARIMSYCILDSPKKDEFLKITATANHQFSNKSGKRNFSVTNRNAFLGMMDGAISGKTGYTAKAGYCYVGALERDDRVYIVALLASGWPNNRTFKWSDTKKLMAYGLENYHYRDVFILPELQAINVIDGVTLSGRPYDKAFADLTIMAEETPGKLLLREDEIVKTTIDLPSVINAPVSKGEQVGSVSYYLGDEKIKEYPIMVNTSVESINYRFIFAYILNYFCL